MGKTEIYFGIVLMLLSMFFFGLTFQFPKQTLAIAPSLFPRVISVGLFIASAVLTMQGVRGFLKGRAGKSAKIKFDITMARFLAMIGISFIYIRILEAVGYVASTPFFIAGTMAFFNEKRWKWIVIVSVATTVILYVLFRIIFRVPLPRLSFF
jgi:putative tricarboxylic transport membrane protein